MGGMQVIGVTVTDGALAAVARRGTRPVVVEWAERVLKRHVRREKTLLVRIKERSKLDAALKADGIPAEACERIRRAFVEKDPVYTTSRTGLAAFLTRAADTMDWIESLPENDRRIRHIERMAWTDAERLAEAWHLSISKARRASKNIMEGTRKLVELEDGAFVAELGTRGALLAEGQAMGHCVGGYWFRVESGSTRIVSIRDRDGHPHVTIELSRAPTLEFEDGSRMLASHRPAKGMEMVTEARSEWVAVQVRGKQNKAPVPKYARHVKEWLDHVGVPWIEYGKSLNDGAAEARRVFTAYGRHFLSAGAACGHGEPKFAEALAKKGDFRKHYEASGLSEIHRFADKDGVVAFFESVVPRLLADFSAMLEKGMTFSVAVGTSGLGRVLGNIAGGGNFDAGVRRKLFDAAVGGDPVSASVVETKLAGIPEGKDLRLVVHSLPLMPLFVLSAGYAGGMEDEVVSMIAPHLRETAVRMAADPAAVHAVKAAKAGVSADDIRKAFMFCGLAAEFAAATAKVDAAVGALVADARVSIRRARGSGKYQHEILNNASNLIAEGFENRIAARVAEREPGRPLLLSACAKPSARMPVHAPRPDPVPKRYRMP